MEKINRRTFLAGSAATCASLAYAQKSPPETSGYALVARQDRKRILQRAFEALKLQPATITAFPSSRSPGGPHDFFSESDYFWPDPKNPAGPYKERDGQSNPDNFTGHRKAMLALSMAVPQLTAAWLLTGKKIYADHALAHLRAWFVTPETRMTPNLEFGQGVRQGVTGRSYGIIDTLHLVEVARAATLLQNRALTATDSAAIKTWFTTYLDWMKTSEKGMRERDAANNHSVAWALQASEFARLIGDENTRDELRVRYRTLLLQQMAGNGSYPRELARTKPYGYSIFNFDVMAGLCWSLGREAEERWQTPDGRGMCRAAEFLYPFLKDKSTWTYAKDVQHFDFWPVRSPGLLFCGLACAKPEYLDLWKSLDPDPKNPEIIRNFPIRQPLLWMQNVN
ncbi:alginate lyase family protein [Terriglobus saanensis]|uniref:Alginate lyase domain-containing protein n=1 Tax=Terriglobus saanensis (strain ATCC BAA-1853 / DSM 23119 / SP1PR4) TaxID=401053 RepID=E8V1H6_TERSS|nr:alginate lyase family protein [Terriglobus saanensis]ADV81171.1 hypothetical protein AciPR4_0334 [Terriglobus saanensis SP1PR4]